ncbi:MAG: hypothetical protein V1799_08310 [bacterium]
MFVRYAFLADTATADAGGKLYAMGIFDNILTTQFPAHHPELTLVARIEGTVAEKGSHKISIELRDSDSNRLHSFDQTLVFSERPAVHGNFLAGLIVKFQTLTFPRAGQYEFVLFGDDRFLVRIHFTVQKINIQND